MHKAMKGNLKLTVGVVWARIKMSHKEVWKVGKHAHG